MMPTVCSDVSMIIGRAYCRRLVAVDGIGIMADLSHQYVGELVVNLEFDS